MDNQNVNYIIHLNQVMRLFANDATIDAADRSLYFALFELWNQYHFPEVLTINSKRVMQISKINSRTTYLKHLRGIEKSGYILYRPSNDARIGSKIKLVRFDTRVDQKLNKVSPDNDHTAVQNMGALYKLKNKQFKNSSKLAEPEDFNEVLLYFREQNWKESDAEDFYWYNENQNWKDRQNLPINNWKHYAKKWTTKAIQKRAYEKKQSASNLHIVNRNKDYGQPL